MFTQKKYWLISKIGLIIFLIGCASSTSQTVKPPGFDRRACLEDKISAYLNSGKSILDSVWYYREAYPMSWPAYDAYIDSLKQEGAKYNVAVVSIPSEDLCPQNVLNKEKVQDKAFMQSYYRKCDSAIKIQKIIFDCVEMERTFLLDSLNLPDPNNGQLILSQDEQLKMEYLGDRYNKSYNYHQDIIKHMHDWTKNHHH